MRILPMLIALALVGFSGCTETPLEPAGTDSTPEGGNETAAPPVDNGTAPEPAANAPPTLVFQSDLAQGQVPFNVTFTIDGEDADGDALNWTIEVNGTRVAEGQAVPGNATVAITTVGNHTFTATLTDGTHEVNASINVLAGAAAVATGYSGPEPLVYEGETTGFDPVSQAGEGCWITYTALPTGAGYSMGGDRSGWSYELADASTHVVIFYDSDNVGQTGDGTGGQVPAGSHYVDVCATPDGAAGASYTLTIYPPGHPDAPA